MRACSQVYRINPDHLPFWTFDAPGAYPPGGQGTGDIINKMADPAVAAGLGPYSYPDPDFLMTVRACGGVGRAGASWLCVTPLPLPFRRRHSL